MIKIPFEVNESNVNRKVAALMKALDGEDGNTLPETMVICKEFLKRVIRHYNEVDPIYARAIWQSIVGLLDIELNQLGIKTDMIVTFGDGLKEAK